MPASPPAEPLVERFGAFLRDPAFPCVGAKSALARSRLRTVVASDMRCGADDQPVYSALRDFSRAVAIDSGAFQSFAVLFRAPTSMDETAFEAALWRRLQSFAAIDAARGEIHDCRVSDDPADPDFSMSLAGEAFFVVGLHPRASRPARRFEAPALVFNPREQFTKLRAAGLYEGLRTKIIARDIALAGEANPMLARHGEISEARQYSGRVVEPEWLCPFVPPARAA